MVLVREMFDRLFQMLWVQFRAAFFTVIRCNYDLVDRLHNDSAVAEHRPHKSRLPSRDREVVQQRLIRARRRR